MTRRPARSEILTVRELVEESDLRLECLAGHGGLDRGVEAVYIGDLDDPTPWMVQGSLLLTTGPKLEAQPEVGVELVRLLKASGMVGVGVAITPHVREIPAAMVAAADAAGLPLLRVPPETPFRRVTGYVSNALASRDMHRLRRSVALQQRLLDVLVAEQDVGGFIARLGELLGVTTVLLGADGGVVARSAEVVPGDADEGLLREAWTAYRAIVRAGMPRSVMSLAGRSVAFRQVQLGGSVVNLLLAVYPPNSLIAESSDAALSFVQRLLEMELAATRNAAVLRRRTRARLLEMLLEGRGVEAELAERLLQHGIEAAAEWRLAALQVQPAGGPLAEAVLPAADAVLEERLVPFVSCRDGDRVLVLTPFGPPPDDAAGVRRLAGEIGEAVRARLQAAAVAVGVSGPMSGTAAVSQAAGQARLALEHALRGRGPAGVSGRSGPSVRAPRARGSDADVSVAFFEDLGAGFEVLDALPEATLQRLAQRVHGKLRDVDRARGTRLAGTLLTFLEAGCSVADAAATLYVHRNTLRKRLARIEKLTGVALQSMDGRVEAYLSARAAELLERRNG